MGKIFIDFFWGFPEKTVDNHVTGEDVTVGGRKRWWPCCLWPGVVIHWKSKY